MVSFPDRYARRSQRIEQTPLLPASRTGKKNAMTLFLTLKASEHVQLLVKSRTWANKRKSKTGLGWYIFVFYYCCFSTCWSTLETTKGHLCGVTSGLWESSATSNQLRHVHTHTHTLGFLDWNMPPFLCVSVCVLSGYVCLYFPPATGEWLEREGKGTQGPLRGTSRKAKKMKPTRPSCVSFVNTWGGCDLGCGWE